MTSATPTEAEVEMVARRLHRLEKVYRAEHGEENEQVREEQFT